MRLDETIYSQYKQTKKNKTMKIVDIYYSHGSCGTMRDMTEETEWIKEALIGKEVEDNRDAEKALSEFFKENNYRSSHIHCGKGTRIGWNIIIE